MASSALRVERVSGLVDLRALRSEWAALHLESRTTNPFAGPTFPILWFERFPDAWDDMWVVTVRADEQLVGVLPLYVRNARFGRPTVVEVPGKVDPWIGPYELPGPLVHPDHARPAMREIVGHLLRSGTGWDWIDLPIGDAVSWLEPEWVASSAAHVSAVVRRPSAITTILRLDDEDGASVSSRRNLKESVRRARNRMTRAYGEDGWKARRVDAPGELAVAFDRLAELHHARSRRTDTRDHADVLAEPAVAAFVREAVLELGKDGNAAIHEIVANDMVIASLLVIGTSTASYVLLSGITDEAWDFSAVTYLQRLAVDDAVVAGLSEVNFSVGPTQAKFRWAQEVRSYRQFVLVGSSRRSQRMFQVAAVLGALRTVRASAGTHRASLGRDHRPPTK